MNENARTYLDFASCVPLSDEARAAMLPWLDGAWNPNAVHADGRRSRALIDDVRAKLAALWKVRAREILFCASGSESIATALIGFAQAHPACRTVVTSAAEHAAVLDTVARLGELGLEIVYLKTDAGAHPDIVQLETVLAARPRESVLVSLMFVNNEVGTISDIAAIATVVRRYGAALHCDAVGAGESVDPAPAIAICDAVSLAAQKTGGPTGAAVLLRHAGFAIRGLIPGGPQEYGLRAGTENCAAIAGAGAAWLQTDRVRAATAERAARMQQNFEARLRAAFSTAELRIAGETGHARTTCISHLAFAGIDNAALLAALDLAGFSLSAGSACAAGATRRSHVADAAGIPAEFTALVRCSWGRQTPDDALDRAFVAISRSVQAAREVESAGR